MIVLTALLTSLSLPLVAMTGYLALLTVVSRRAPAPVPEDPRLRFSVIVPAHNEALGIARTVENLKALEWPADLFEVVVVADNCIDDTAGAAEKAGATVLVRDDPERKGKGYALAHAFERSVAAGRDAVVVVDADTVVSPNLLKAFSSRIALGARAVQADYAVMNVDASWRTRLMAIALGMFHVLRSLGRERLGLSCGLRGNGMCFTSTVLTEVPHDAFSIVEDVEYGIRLGLSGYRVHYAEEAHVFGEMVSGEKASRSQRRRWESGRAQLLREHAGPLIGAAWHRRDKVLADLAADLLVPPLSTLAVACLAGATASALLVYFIPSWLLGIPLAAWVVCLFFLAAYVARGWTLSGTGLRGLAAMARAPWYIAWKLSLRLRPAPGPRAAAANDDWVRTAREAEPPPSKRPR